MKKFICVTTALLVMFACAFSACGKSKTPTEDPPQDPPTVVDPPIDGDEYADGIYFREIKNDETVAYAVQKFDAESKETKIDIPKTFKGMPVTAIDDNAFLNAEKVEEVTIPDSVVSIGKNAFDGCTGLKSVKLGLGVESIGSGAFARCDSLQTVDVQSVEDWCKIRFENMSSNPMYFATQFKVLGETVKDLVIGDSVQSVPDYAFYCCENIESVIVGSGVESIGESAFYGCNKLKSVDLDGKISDMGELAFAECEALESVEIGESVTSIGDYAFFDCACLAGIEIPSNVKTIGESAFSTCTALKSVELNEGLESIGDCAFGGCVALEKLEIPSSVISIGFGVAMFVGGLAFDGAEMSANQLGEITLSDNLTEIPQFAFSGANITTIKIPQKAELVDYSAFYGCALLESVILPKAIKELASYAFYRCDALSAVYFEGSKEEWSEVKVGRGNSMENATVYYYSPTTPREEGNFWHYSPDGTAVKWG